MMSCTSVRLRRRRRGMVGVGSDDMDGPPAAQHGGRHGQIVGGRSDGYRRSSLEGLEYVLVSQEALRFSKSIFLSPQTVEMDRSFYGSTEMTY